jgi:hypothetical protein
MWTTLMTRIKSPYLNLSKFSQAAMEDLPGVYHSNIPGVFVFPVYNEKGDVLDVVTIHKVLSRGYSAKLGELTGDRLAMAREMMMELRANPRGRIVNHILLH